MGHRRAGRARLRVVYDRFGLRGLAVLPVLAAIVPFLSFTTSPALVWAGALVLGVHVSAMRGAVTDLVTAHWRGTGYGTFTAVYGLAWLAGGAVLGALYDTSLLFVLATQAAALAAFLPLRSPSGALAPTPRAADGAAKPERRYAPCGGRP